MAWPWSAATTRTFTLRSEGGEVRLSAMQGTSAEVVTAIAAGNLSSSTFAQTYIPGGRQTGIKLNKNWADEIRDTLYTPYILLNTDVIAIIEVEAGGFVSTNTRPTLNRRTDTARLLHEHSL